MTDKNDARSLDLRDIPAAAGLLTRLPIPVDAEHAMARAARATWAYPLVGLILAFLTLGPTHALLWLGLAPSIAALLLLALLILMTGALHEDGLADCADGFWGGYTPQRRLEIMKDSHIGTYGVLALGLSLLIRWQALAVLLEQNAYLAIAAALIASRAAIVVLMDQMPNARPSGLSAKVGAPPWVSQAIACLLATVALMAVNPLAILFLAAFAWACARLARAKIGGQTGDVLGGTQQISEITVLIVLATSA